MAAMTDRKGNLYALFRSATEMVHRDIYLLTSADGGDHFQGANIAPWNVGACVMSSESFSESPAGMLAAWEQMGQVFYGVVNAQTPKLGSSVPAPGQATLRKHPVVVGNSRGGADSRAVVVGAPQLERRRGRIVVISAKPVAHFW